MTRLLGKFTLVALGVVLVVSCSTERTEEMKFTGAKGEVKIMTLDPGHFHAALVQKKMYDQVSPEVYVYAPDGPDFQDHLARIEGFNTSAENPTTWQEKVYKGDDYLDKMLAEKPGNVMVTSGNNMKKTDYIKATVDAGINVLADKPMCIDQKGWETLKAAFESAEQNGVLLFDIMTERYEITTILQKEFANAPEVFGTLQTGTPEDPAVTKESVHHLYKLVAGKPNKRPPWFFDVKQQGEGVVDIGTHLVDMVMWECFPEQIIDYTKDIEMVSAKRWPTIVSKEQFEKATRLPDFPDYLKDKLYAEGNLPYYCNGKAIFKLKGIHAKISVVWNFEAPAGTGDTHFSVMKGSKANVVIKQGEEQKYRPELYVEPTSGVDATVLEKALKKHIETLQAKYSGVALEKQGKIWHVIIPDKYRVGHEAHFGQVAEKYLQYLVDGKLPDWEVPNMIAKYYTTTKALELAQK